MNRRKLAPLLIAIYFLFSPIRAMAVVPTSAETTKGIELFKANNFSEAVILFEKALAINSTDEVALYYKACTLIKLGEIHLARETFKQIVATCKGKREVELAEQGLRELDSSAMAPHAVAGRASTRQSLPNRVGPASSNAPADHLPTHCVIPYDVNQSNQPTFDVSINSTVVSAIFDTGANHCVLPIDIAKSAGIRIPSPGSPDGVYKRTGQKIWQITADIKVGNIERKNCPLLLFEPGAFPRAILIGTDFFTDYTMAERSEGTTKELVFEREQGARAEQAKLQSSPEASSYTSASEIVIPLQKYSGKGVLLPCKINGVNTKILFDTGASRGITITRESIDRANLPMNDVSRVYGLKYGNPYQTTSIDLQIGSFRNPNVLTYIHDSATLTCGTDYPIFGTLVFEDQGYTWKVDNAQNVLILQRAH